MLSEASLLLYLHCTVNVVLPFILVLELVVIS